MILKNTKNLFYRIRWIKVRNLQKDILNFGINLKLKLNKSKRFMDINKNKVKSNKFVKN